jgi:hypothetical protein
MGTSDLVEQTDKTQRPYREILSEDAREEV